MLMLLPPRLHSILTIFSRVSLPSIRFQPLIPIPSPIYIPSHEWLCANLPRACGSPYLRDLGGLLGLSHYLIISNCMSRTRPTIILLKYFSSKLRKTLNLMFSWRIPSKHYFPSTKIERFVQICHRGHFRLHSSSTFIKFGQSPNLNIHGLGLGLVRTKLLPSYKNKGEKERKK